jgi:hypothetical protein
VDDYPWRNPEQPRLLIRVRPDHVSAG